MAFTVGAVRLRSRLMGSHGISNILAGIAVARVFGIDTTDLADAIAELKPGKMRGERIAGAVSLFLMIPTTPIPMRSAP